MAQKKMAGPAAQPTTAFRGPAHLQSWSIEDLSHTRDIDLKPDLPYTELTGRSMYPQKAYYVERPKEIYPSEADGIAGELDRAAKVIEATAQNLHRVRSKLENTWTGNAKNRFFEPFDNMPRRVEELSAEVEAHAAQIRGITVTIMERVLIHGPIPW